MLSRLLLVLLLAGPLGGCLKYEYEHEFWVKVDGSGTVYVTGRPALWQAFKALPAQADEEALRASARALFEGSGLSVRRITVTWRGGQPYLFVAADFKDVNALSATPAFVDLQIALRKEGERLRLEGQWVPRGRPAVPAEHQAGLMAVRFHLPSKVYEHKNAVEGVERGNIVAWRQELAAGARGQALPFGAVIDERSILHAAVGLFAGAIALGLLAVGGVFYLVVRKGRRTLDAEGAAGA